jgi:IclR family KDG regulon transcriptional repressor
MLLTISRAGRVLDLFSLEQQEWGATAVAKKLDIAKSQAHELLVSLADVGLLQRVRPGRYRLGWRMLSLHALLLDHSDLGRETERVMRSLGDRYGETLQLAMWGPEEQAICVAASAGRLPIAIAPWPVGVGVPAHCTGVGKVLLASRPWEEVREMFAGAGIARMTDRTIASIERLREELATVRRRGFAFEDEEYALDTCGVAAPLLNRDGDVIAALSMSVPAHRWQATRHEYTRALVVAARGVSRFVRHGKSNGDDGPSGGRLAVLEPANAAASRFVRNSRTAD